MGCDPLLQLEEVVEEPTFDGRTQGIEMSTAKTDPFINEAQVGGQVGDGGPEGVARLSTPRLQVEETRAFGCGVQSRSLSAGSSTLRRREGSLSSRYGAAA